jgi:hypothetical protein
MRILARSFDPSDASLPHQVPETRHAVLVAKNRPQRWRGLTVPLRAETGRFFPVAAPGTSTLPNSGMLTAQAAVPQPGAAQFIVLSFRSAPCPYSLGADDNAGRSNPLHRVRPRQSRNAESRNCVDQPYEKSEFGDMVGNNTCISHTDRDTRRTCIAVFQTNARSLKLLTSKDVRMLRRS